MKKFLFVSLLSTIFFIACNKDDEKVVEQITNSSLIGTWKVTEVKSENTKIFGKIKTPIGETPFNSEVPMTGKDYNMRITFADKPKKISSKGSFVIVVSVEIPIMGSKKYEQKISELPAVNGDWNVQDNTLVTTNLGKTTTIKIISYDKNEIVFSYALEEDDNNFINSTESFLKDMKIKGNLVLKAIRE